MATASTPSPGAAPSSTSSAASRETSTAAEILAALPRWLQPGVSPMTHIILRAVLFSLNFFLACLVAMRLFSPHFEIMLLLSIALTVSYFVFVAEINKLYAQTQSQLQQQQRSDNDQNKKEE
ncbi:hypothetical protein BWQ96_09201 [Gracilariopsis chorda]|uniref:Uncharacterized protein n=1 Tax=Gracilariopsis chorda TaxID=448386 RepID=A0A2V3IG98_9FLOR|nr:hypothetical protein BWQ96_09201 [Gracilariopsis chorda]|eukprot:PXF41097.1 hypothetical protein BWQ96_09201 [Gracilariopsis chorda]